MLSKNERIRQSNIETRQRRATQRCLVFSFKINEKKLSKSDFKKLEFMFVQARWLYNYILGLENIKACDTKNKTIYSYDKDKNKVERTLNLNSKVIQGIKQGIEYSLKTLLTTKKKGKKVGKLKFKSDYNSIELNQYKNTHEIKEKGIRVCGFKRPLRIFGLKQIKDKKYEFANAKLVKKPTGFYIKLTCFENLNHDRINQVTQNQKSDVGLDFGIKTNITTSDNEKFDISIGESERLKGLQKKFSRQIKGSNNRNKTLRKMKVEYERLNNKKKDFGNKLVNYLCTKYHTVYMQDEMISNWKKTKRSKKSNKKLRFLSFGKEIQYSCLGYIKSKLSKQPNVVMIDRSYHTTKMCYKCGNLHQDITLNDRIFTCPHCGYSEERDLNAAKTILFIGQCKNTYVPVERRNTDVEKMSDFLVSYETKKQSSVKHRS